MREAGVERITVVTAEPLEGYEVWDDRGLAWNDALAAAIGRGRDRAARRGRLRRPALLRARGGRGAARRDARARNRDRARARRRDERGRDAAARASSARISASPAAPPSTRARRRPRGRRSPRASPSTSTRRRISRGCRPHGLKLGYKASAEQFPPRRAARLLGRGGAARARDHRRLRPLPAVPPHRRPRPRRACPGSARSASAPSGRCSARACSPRRCATTRR